MSTAQKAIVVHLRKTLLLPLDDLTAGTRKFLCPAGSRSGIDRCLSRHGVSNLNALRPKTPTLRNKAFKSHEPGFVRIDIKYLLKWPTRTSAATCL